MILDLFSLPVRWPFLHQIRCILSCMYKHMNESWGIVVICHIVADIGIEGSWFLPLSCLPRNTRHTYIDVRILLFIQLISKYAVFSFNRRYNKYLYMRSPIQTSLWSIIKENQNYSLYLHLDDSILKLTYYCQDLVEHWIFITLCHLLHE